MESMDNVEDMKEHNQSNEEAGGKVELDKYWLYFGFLFIWLCYESTPLKGKAMQLIRSISTHSKEEKHFSIREPHVHFTKVSFTASMKYGWEDKRASASGEPSMCVVTNPKKQFA